ncbi:hypothetical protein [Gulosibacter bifidus]|uniref:Lipoprotein n=1 Tax=Gulosibacter bifidus TaxID=272239 RepID=A0ABW5RKN0_9MICO|nr:hypothetical protein [Gulosibacter bifidus]
MSTSLKYLRGASALAALLAGGLALTGCSQAANDAGTSATDATAAPAVTTAPTETDGAVGELTVIVTEATLVDGNIETRAVVTGHIGDGTCKVTATSASGETLTGEAAAVPDAQSTSCPLVVLEGADPSADWKVTVEYTGDGVSGTSEATTTEVL